MSWWTFREYVARHLKIGKRKPPALSRGEIERRATNARLVLEHQSFVEAYQDELGDIVEDILRTDVTDPGERERLTYLVARAQELQAICRRLAGYVNTHQYTELRAERRSA
jgi:hypothetical protein